MNRFSLAVCCMLTPFMIFGNKKWPSWPFKRRSLTPKSFKWKRPGFLFFRNGTLFVFAPGVMHYEGAIINFCRKYTTSTGITLESKTGIELIDSDYCCTCNFSEIVIPDDPAQEKKQRVFSKGVLPRFFYRFGTWVRHKRLNKKYGKEPNYREKKFHLNLKELNIGQESDQVILSELYEKSVRRNKRKSVVMYGFSRGAATTFNFMATKYAKQSKQKVKAVVLQGCFDSIDNTMGKLKRFFLNRMLPNFSDANNKRQEPIHLVDDFPFSIPVLFITSECDELVPASSTCTLANALRAAGHPHVYLLVLKRSPHSRYTSHDSEDTKKVECIVHAFYKQFGVSYIRSLAKEGKNLLSECKL